MLATARCGMRVCLWRMLGPVTDRLFSDGEREWARRTVYHRLLADLTTRVVLSKVYPRQVLVRPLVRLVVVSSGAWSPGPAVAQYLYQALQSCGVRHVAVSWVASEYLEGADKPRAWSEPLQRWAARRSARLVSGRKPPAQAFTSTLGSARAVPELPDSDSVESGSLQPSSLSSDKTMPSSYSLLGSEPQDSHYLEPSPLEPAPLWLTTADPEQPCVVNVFLVFEDDRAEPARAGGPGLAGPAGGSRGALALDVFYS